MANDPFSLGLLQAVNDWQRGGDAKQKQRRGQRLKEAASCLPPSLRRTALSCFRQVALDKRHVWKLHETLYLIETISSWTLTTDVAKQFEGGVPAEGHGLQGVIFELVPPPDTVVVNLDALYRDPGFQEACSRLQASISGFAQGVGTYGNSQNEVVLEIDSLPVSAIYAYGGHSSSREDIARQFFGRQPALEEWQWFDDLLNRSPKKLGPNWLCGEAKDRVIAKALATVERLREEQPKP